MSKKLLAAGEIRAIQFDTEEEMDTYLNDLIVEKQIFIVLETWEQRDGSIIIRILQQYK